MTVLHVTYSFPPDPPGGTELYVEALSRELAAIGVRSVIVAPETASDRDSCAVGADRKNHDLATGVGVVTVRRGAAGTARRRGVARRLGPR